MKRIKLALCALAGSCGALAHADTATYTDVGNNYSVTIDTDVWGSDVLSTGANVRIFNLYDVATLGSSRGARTAGYFDDMLNGVTFSALAGYSISSITVGWTGSYNLSGTSDAYTRNQLVWITNGSDSPGLTELKHVYCDQCNSGDPSTTVVNSSAGNFDVQFSQVFAANTSTATFSNWIEGSVSAFGVGSSAQLAQASVYFNVVTAPVPEPETYAMFLAGLLFMAGVARRRGQR